MRLPKLIDIPSSTWETPEPEDQNESWVGDVGTDLKVGAGQLVKSVAGLADLATAPFRDGTGKTVTEFVGEDLGLNEAEKEWQAEYSPARKESDARVREFIDEGDSELERFARTIGAYAINPRSLLGVGVQSLPSAVAGGGAGGFAARAVGSGAKAAMAARLGSAAGEGALSGGGVAANIIEGNREAGRDAYENVGYAIPAGLATAAVGTYGNAEAQLFSRAAREAGAGAAQAGFKGAVKDVAKTGLKESVEEGLQSPTETISENLALDRPWEQGLGENIGAGMAAGFGMGGAIQTTNHLITPGKERNLLGSDTPKGSKPYSTSSNTVSVENPESDVQARVDELLAEHDAKVREEAANDAAAQVPTPVPATAGPAPATGAAPAPAPAPTAVPENAPAAPEAAPAPAAPAVLDAEGVRGVFGGARSRFLDPTRDVPKKVVKDYNELAARPLGAELLDGVIAGATAAGSGMKADRAIRLVNTLLNEGVTSIEEAVGVLEQMRDGATREADHDLYDATAYALGHPDEAVEGALSYLETRRAARQASKTPAPKPAKNAPKPVNSKGNGVAPKPAAETTPVAEPVAVEPVVPTAEPVPEKVAAPATPAAPAPKRPMPAGASKVFSDVDETESTPAPVPKAEEPKTEPAPVEPAPAPTPATPEAVVEPKTEPAPAAEPVPAKPVAEEKAPAPKAAPEATPASTTAPAPKATPVATPTTASKTKDDKKPLDKAEAEKARTAWAEQYKADHGSYPTRAQHDAWAQEYQEKGNYKTAPKWDKSHHALLTSGSLTAPYKPGTIEAQAEKAEQKFRDGLAPDARQPSDEPVAPKKSEERQYPFAGLDQVVTGRKTEPVEPPKVEVKKGKELDLDQPFVPPKNEKKGTLTVRENAKPEGAIESAETVGKPVVAEEPKAKEAPKEEPKEVAKEPAPEPVAEPEATPVGAIESAETAGQPVAAKPVEPAKAKRKGRAAPVTELTRKPVKTQFSKLSAAEKRLFTEKLTEYLNGLLEKYGQTSFKDDELLAAAQVFAGQYNITVNLATPALKPFRTGVKSSAQKEAKHGGKHSEGAKARETDMVRDLREQQATQATANKEQIAKQAAKARTLDEFFDAVLARSDNDKADNLVIGISAQAAYHQEHPKSPRKLTMGKLIAAVVERVASSEFNDAQRDKVFKEVRGHLSTLTEEERTAVGEALASTTRGQDAKRAYDEEAFAKSALDEAGDATYEDESQDEGNTLDSDDVVHETVDQEEADEPKELDFNEPPRTDDEPDSNELTSDKYGHEAEQVGEGMQSGSFGASSGEGKRGADRVAKVKSAVVELLQKRGLVDKKAKAADVDLSEIADAIADDIFLRNEVIATINRVADEQFSDAVLNERSTNSPNYLNGDALSRAALEFALLMKPLGGMSQYMEVPAWRRIQKTIGVRLVESASNIELPRAQKVVRVAQGGSTSASITHPRTSKQLSATASAFAKDSGAFLLTPPKTRTHSDVGNSFAIPYIDVVQVARAKPEQVDGLMTPEVYSGVRASLRLFRALGINPSLFSGVAIADANSGSESHPATESNKACGFCSQEQLPTPRDCTPLHPEATTRPYGGFMPLIRIDSAKVDDSLSASRRLFIARLVTHELWHAIDSVPQTTDDGRLVTYGRSTAFCKRLGGDAVYEKTKQLAALLSDRPKTDELRGALDYAASTADTAEIFAELMSLSMHSPAFSAFLNEHWPEATRAIQEVIDNVKNDRRSIATGVAAAARLAQERVAGKDGPSGTPTELLLRQPGDDGNAVSDGGLVQDGNPEHQGPASNPEEVSSPEIGEGRSDRGNDDRSGVFGGAEGRARTGSEPDTLSDDGRPRPVPEPVRSDGGQAPLPPGSGYEPRKGSFQSRILARLPAGMRPFVRSLMTTAGHAASTHGLGWLFTRDLVAYANGKLRDRAPDFLKKYTAIHQALLDMASFRNDWQSKAAVIDQKFKRLNADSASKVNELLADVTIAGIWPFAAPGRFQTRTVKRGKNTVQITAGEAWQHYVDKVMGNPETAARFEELRNRYEALPDDAKEVVRDVLQHGLDSVSTRKSAVVSGITAIYQDGIKAALEIGDTEGAKKLEAERDAQIKEVNQRFASSNTPYVPLRRFGDFVVTRKSKDYAKQEAVTAALLKRINQRTGNKPTAKDMEPYNAALNELNRMKADGEMYEVQTFPTMGKAKEAVLALQEEYPDDTIEAFPAAERVGQLVPSYQKLEQVVASLNQAVEDGRLVEGEVVAARQMLAVAKNLYIRELSNENVMKSSLRRQKVAGFHENMMENFMETNRAESFALSNMRYGPMLRKSIGDSRQELRKLTGDTRTQATQFYNELVKRVGLSMGGDDSRIASTIMRGTSMWLLMTNPAFYIQNITQPMMMSAPLMAGRYGLKAFTMQASLQAEIARAAWNGKRLDDLEGMLQSPEEWLALDRARDHGLVDIGITQDFGHISADAVTVPGTRVVKRVSDKLTDIARQVETINRVSTFLTAYRLAAESGKDAAEAGRYAEWVLEQSHGDYSGTNAPRYFRANAFAKIATQFRKFQLIQLGMMFRLVKDSFKGATPQERLVARHALTWTLGVHMAMAGAIGTPFMALAMGAIGLAFGDAGEDDEETLRRLIGDKATADLLLRGVPMALGVDLAEKVGASNMLGILPYYDYSAKSGRSGWYELVGNAMGPASSIGAKAFTAAQYLSTGDFWKAFEQVAPTGVANVSKALRMGTEGWTTRSGDVVIPADEVSLFELALQGAGFTTSRMSDRNRITAGLVRHEEKFDAMADRIRQDYRKAAKAKDNAGMREARVEWQKMNEARKRQGFRPVQVGSLVKAARDQRKREGRVVGGVVSDRSNRGYLERASDR